MRKRLYPFHLRTLVDAAITSSLLVACGTPGGFKVARAAHSQQKQEKMRERQEATFANPGPVTIQGEASKSYVGNRRWMIFPASSVTKSDGNEILSLEPWESGMATALTADGYFLTAAHVVGDEPPVALNRRDARPARIVKVFPDSDLAVIKFPFKVNRYFEKWVDDIEEGDHVLSAAAKGTVTTRGATPWHKGQRLIDCRLPSTPGQSGGPVANADGELVGIITRGYRSRLTGRLISSTWPGLAIVAAGAALGDGSVISATHRGASLVAEDRLTFLW